MASAGPSSPITQPPEEYLCPITLQLMENPVIASDEQTCRPSHAIPKLFVIAWLLHADCKLCLRCTLPCACIPLDVGSQGHA